VEICIVVSFVVFDSVDTTYSEVGAFVVIELDIPAIVEVINLVEVSKIEFDTLDSTNVGVNNLVEVNFVVALVTFDGVDSTIVDVDKIVDIKIVVDFDKVEAYMEGLE